MAKLYAPKSHTETDDVPLALLAFQGRLVAGVGKALRIHGIRKKKLLRKVENKKGMMTLSRHSPHITLNTQESRIIVAPENCLLVFADDSQSRWVTVGDRFGNVVVNRLDPKESEQVDEDPTGAGILHEQGVLIGAPHKTKMIAHFHVGDLITSIHKVAMVAGGREILLYTGLHGTVGILVPFISKEDVDFILTLEQHLRTEQGSLVGRDHERVFCAFAIV
ncbi:Cleavage/polyadenylation specificity factor, A subunit [Lentinula detonsa]|uniref:Cleavage/polyadenylation specificity factor, A subunit n=1 Tax=Lentinula detonsa TaxID=2804962 RepID=A0AA38PR77_9AGAR|nr:Cleavage/polyadenylation specificity factor, A subunit [Lentinula detonsa]